MDVFDDILYGCFGAGILHHVLFYLLGSVHHGGVVSSAKFLANRGHGQLGDVPHHIHGDLSCVGNSGVAFGGPDIVGGYAEGAAHLFDDLFDGHGRRLIVIDDIADGRLGGIDAGSFALQQIIGF